jgi:hypothetical protein
MPMSANPAARSALVYITAGALIDVWAGVWWWYMRSNVDSGGTGAWGFVCNGLLLTGVVLIVIGLLVGRIGREARHADAPPVGALDAQAAANARLANVNAAVAAETASNATAGLMPGTVLVNQVPLRR